MLAWYGLGLVLGRPLVSQNDHAADGSMFGSLLNHITVGRFTAGEPAPRSCFRLQSCSARPLEQPRSSAVCVLDIALLDSLRS